MKHESLPLCRRAVPGGMHQRQLVRSGLRMQSADESVLPRKRRAQEETRHQALIFRLSYQNLSAIAFGLCVAQRPQLYTTQPLHPSRSHPRAAFHTPSIRFGDCGHLNLSELPSSIHPASEMPAVVPPPYPTQALDPTPVAAQSTTPLSEKHCHTPSWYTNTPPPSPVRYRSVEHERISSYAHWRQCSLCEGRKPGVV